jgi:ATP-dependent DNA helicase RecG
MLTNFLPNLEALVTPDRKLVPEQLKFDFDSLLPPKAELRDLWTPDDILKAARKDGAWVFTSFTEDDRVEWKSARYPARDLADYLSMWANTQPNGGLIIVGIEQDGLISGCSGIGTAKVSDLQSSCYEHCPDANVEFHRIPATRSDGSPDYVLAIRVLYRPDRLVETVRHEAFVRAGRRKRRLTEDEKREIRIGKGQIEYEKEPVNLRYPADFDDALIADFCKQFREKRSLSIQHTREQLLRLNHLALLWQIGLSGADEEFLTVRAPRGWRPCEEVENGLPYGGHALLWRRSPDSFFPSRCFEAAGLEEGIGDHGHQGVSV